jgi:ATP-dependent helicase/DNAse subunit B
MPTLYFAPQIQPLLDNARELKEDLADDGTWKFITPNRNAADTLGIPEYKLKSLAQDILKTHAIKIASPLVGQHHLRQALRQVLSPQDEEGVARVWLPTIQEILRAQLSLPQSQQLSPRAGQVLQVSQRYQELLRQAGYIDDSEVYWQAIAQQPQKLPLVIYGYFDPMDDELAFIQAIADHDSVLYLLDGDHRLFSHQKQLREKLAMGGWKERQLKVNQPAQNAPITTGEALSLAFLGSTPITPEQNVITAQVYPDSEAEARGILSQIKQLLHQGVLSRDIVIVATNDTQWGDRLVDIAWEYDIALRLPYNIAIADTRVGAWVTLLLEVLDQQWSFELTNRFLQHPLSRTLGKNLWGQLQESRPSNFEAWRSLILAGKNIDIAPLQLPEQAPRSQWLKQFHGIFDLFDLRRQAKTWAKESLACKNLLEGLQDCLSLADETLTWEQFRGEMLTYLKLLQTVAAPGREGVELHNLYSIVGAKYDHVFVMDSREGNLPKPITKHPVLDFYERQQLQTQGIISLATASASTQKEIFAFYTLLQTPDQKCTFSYGKIFSHLGSYAPTDPSAYLKELGLQPTPARLEIIPSVETARQIYLRRAKMWTDEVLSRAIQAWQVEKYRESSEPQNEYDGVVGIPFDYSDHLFSASQLTQLGQCPFKWFANKLLKLAEVEEAEADLSHSLKGSLYHKVLELALKAFQDEPSINFTEDDNLRTWFIQAERHIADEKKINFTQFPAWEHQRWEHIQTLKRAMENPEFLPDAAEILGLEIDFEQEFAGLKIRGRVDRLDRRDDGLVLIDYKSGAKVPNGIKDHEGKAKIDLQLPLYQAVGATSLYPGEPIQKTMYYSIAKAKDISPKKKISEGDLVEIIERFKVHFDTGSYPVAPDQDQEACKYCAHDSVCRRGDRLQRKGV